MQDERVSRSDGLRLALGLGLLAGLFEVAAGLSGSRLPLGTTDILALTGLAAAVSTVVALALALLAGPIHGWMRSSPTHHAVAAQLGVVATGLAILQAAPYVRARLAEGRSGAALMLLAMAVLAGLAVLFNARFLLLRVVRKQPVPLGWLPVSALLTGGGATLLSAAHHPTSPPGDGADVLLITVDGLRHDALGQGDTPALDALAARGALFSQLTVPSSSSLANHATLLTGLHPLQHQALDDLHPLGPVPTLAERVGGVPLGAFVSSVTLAAHSGLGAGFDVYDDHTGGLRGLDALPLTRRVAARWLGGGLRRDDADTIAAWRAWREQAGPGLGWVHLAGLLPEGPLPGRTGDWSAQRAALRGRLGVLDGQVGAMVEGLPAETLVIVASAGGLVLGEHGLGPYDPAAWDTAVLAPTILAGPGVERGEIILPARLVDVSTTLLRATGASAGGDGIDLVEQTRVPREQSTLCVLWARNLDGGPILGLRNGGVKYLHDLDNDVEWLFDLAADPTEQHDLAASEPDAVRRARDVLAPDRAALAGLADLPTIPSDLADRVQRLRGHP